VANDKYSTQKYMKNSFSQEQGKWEGCKVTALFTHLITNNRNKDLDSSQKKTG